MLRFIESISAVSMEYSVTELLLYRFGIILDGYWPRREVRILSDDAAVRIRSEGRFLASTVARHDASRAAL
jgi:hypothetical protein